MCVSSQDSLICPHVITMFLVCHIQCILCNPLVYCVSLSLCIVYYALVYYYVLYCVLCDLMCPCCDLRGWSELSRQQKWTGDCGNSTQLPQ